MICSSIDPQILFFGVFFGVCILLYFINSYPYQIIMPYIGFPCTSANYFPKTSKDV
jgi:hypothetical protein